MEKKKTTHLVIWGLFCLYQGVCAHRRLSTSLEVETNLLALELRCEGGVYMLLINLNSHSKRPGTRGSLRINLNGSFISLTQTQMLPATTWRIVGCPKTRLCCPIIVPVMLSRSFYRNQNGLIKQQQQQKKFHLLWVCPLPDSQDKRAGSWEEGNTNMHLCSVARAHWLSAGGPYLP